MPSTKDRYGRTIATCFLGAEDVNAIWVDPANGDIYIADGYGSQFVLQYDAKGKFIQKTDDKGRHYNAKGQYQGKTTRDGKHYDAKGKLTGKTVTAPTGSKSYDAKGKLLQKTDERGRIYDAKGSYQGKVKPVSPVKSEKRDVKGKLVEVKKTDDSHY